MDVRDKKRQKDAAYSRVWYQNNKGRKAATRKIYRERNKEKIALTQYKWDKQNKDLKVEMNRVWYQNNKKRLAPIRKEWRERNKDAVAASQRMWEKENYSTNIQYKLGVVLRHRLQYALRKWPGVRVGSAVRDLGCTIPELVIHLEKLFQSGMTWSNHGQWHIDHITPLAVFDLTNREQLLQACHYTNLQPLWAKENQQKSKKLVSDIIVL